MTEPLPDTWHNRDLPVLRHIVAESEKPWPRITVGQISSEIRINGRLGLDRESTKYALRALERDNLVTVEWLDRRNSTGDSHIVDFSGEAYRAVGAWPTPDTAAVRLIAALEHIAKNTDDDDERTRVRKILEGFAGSGRQIAVSVATAMATGQIT